MYRWAQKAVNKPAFMKEDVSFSTLEAESA